MLNAAAALVAAGKARTRADGIKLAQHAVNSGEAEGSLGRLFALVERVAAAAVGQHRKLQA
ncbi:MAG TPA: hypothetical protein VKP67_21160 [Xanthobacteraceae bacterium]|nr:hypothetical protein [Xanthobacteraceae bacterium]